MEGVTEAGVEVEDLLDFLGVGVPPADYPVKDDSTKRLKSNIDSLVLACTVGFVDDGISADSPWRVSAMTGMKQLSSGSRKSRGSPSPNPKRICSSSKVWPSNAGWTSMRIPPFAIITHTHAAFRV